MALECGSAQPNRLIVPPRNITLWAGQAYNGIVVSDGSTVPGADSMEYPDGSVPGQAGWDVCITFQDLADLARLLSCGLELPKSSKLEEDKSVCGNWVRKCSPTNLRPGEISRLAIYAHGDDRRNWGANGAHRNVLNDEATGRFKIDKLVLENPVNVNNIENYRESLETIGKATRPDATIVLMGCCLGCDQRGTDLLTALAQIWPGRTVVGFTTFGYTNPGLMGAEHHRKIYPGMRITHERDTIFVGDLQKERWNIAWAANDLRETRWASEFSEHAKALRTEPGPYDTPVTKVVRWPSKDELLWAPPMAAPPGTGAGSNAQGQQKPAAGAGNPKPGGTQGRGR